MFLKDYKSWHCIFKVSLYVHVFVFFKYTFSYYWFLPDSDKYITHIASFSHDVVTQEDKHN